jgi:hypothetical protein
MGQVILVGSYVGFSGYQFHVEVTGRPLSLDEVKQLGFVNDDELRRHEESSYTKEWFEIKPGDIITVSEMDDNKDQTLIFEVPEVPLPELPQRLDDVWHKPSLVECLRKYCHIIKSSNKSVCEESRPGS